MVRRSPRGCLRRLYADEEGRATMTRDDVSGAPQRAPSGKQTHPRAARTEGRAVPRGGARADGMPLWLVLRCPSPGTLLLLLLPPSSSYLLRGITFQRRRRARVLRIHTLTCHHRAKKSSRFELSEPILPPPPSYRLTLCPRRGRIARCEARAESKRAVVIARVAERRDVRTYPYASPLPSPSPLYPPLLLAESLSRGETSPRVGFSRLVGVFVCSRRISRAIRHEDSRRAVL